MQIELRHVEYRGDNKDLAVVTFEDVAARSIHGDTAAYTVCVARNGHVISVKTDKRNVECKPVGKSKRVPDGRKRESLAKEAHFHAFISARA